MSRKQRLQRGAPELPKVTFWKELDTEEAEAHQHELIPETIEALLQEMREAKEGGLDFDWSSISMWMSYQRGDDPYARAVKVTIHFTALMMPEEDDA